MGGRLFTEMRVIWRLEVLALGRLTVPPQLPALTPPTLVGGVRALYPWLRRLIWGV